MRNLGLAAASAMLAITLSSCGKSTTEAPQPSPGAANEQTAEGATSPPVELTEDQKKAIVAAMPAPYNTGDLENGETKFAICKSCHTLTPGGPDLTGPNLSGVFGRKVASKPGYNYSDALKAQTFTWDAARLDTWLTDPKAMVPGTKMTFVGFKDAKDRIDVIAYLKAETSPQ